MGRVHGPRLIKGIYVNLITLAVVTILGYQRDTFSLPLALLPLATEECVTFLRRNISRLHRTGAKNYQSIINVIVIDIVRIAEGVDHVQGKVRKGRL
jgi:hypothetical protein